MIHALPRLVGVLCDGQMAAAVELRLRLEGLTPSATHATVEAVLASAEAKKPVSIIGE